MTERRMAQTYALVDASMPADEERLLRAALLRLGVVPQVRTLPLRRARRVRADLRRLRR